MAVAILEQIDREQQEINLRAHRRENCSAFR